MHANTKVSAILTPIMMLNQKILGHPSDEFCCSTDFQFGVRNARDLSLEPCEPVQVIADVYQDYKVPRRLQRVIVTN